MCEKIAKHNCIGVNLLGIKALVGIKALAFYSFFLAVITILLAALTSSGAFAAPAELWKTGQATTFAPGDDGSKQAGVAWPIPRFTDNSNGTVTDNLTGLVWLKDAGCLGIDAWDTAISSANSLASGSCGLTDGSAAGAWRLPNRKELFSLIDYSRFTRALPQGHPFLNVESDWYWSGTTYAPNTGFAWVINMDNGFVFGGSKSGNGHVWPVRSGQGGSFGNLVILNSITPDSVLPGNAVNVTLAGTNFISGMTVNVSGAGVTVSNVTVNSSTSSTAVFTIDANAATGVRTVSVTTSSGTSNTVNFTINTPNTPVPTPTPTPIPTPIVEAPKADFTADPLIGGAPLKVQFTDRSTGNPTSWVWEFGDGGRRFEQNPSNTYQKSGLYTVKLSVSNSAGKDSKEKKDMIEVVSVEALDADFTIDKSTGFVPFKVTFTDISKGAPASWIWEFGDGGTSGQQHPGHEYLSAGLYTVSLTVSRQGGETDTERRPNLINVIENRPVADFKASVTAGQSPLKVGFTDLSQPVGNIANWVWDFSDGATETIKDPEHQYNTEGFYTVSLTVSNPAGADSEIKTNLITVKGQNVPVADFITNKTVGLAPFAVSFFDQSEPVGKIASWIWEFGDGMKGITQHPTHSYDKEGIFTVTLTVSNSFGADSETKTNLIAITGTSDDVLAGFSANNNVGVLPLSVQFKNDSAGDREKIESRWEFGDSAISTEMNPSHIYNKAGDFDVSLSVNGVTSADTKKETGFIKVINKEDVAAWFTASPVTGGAPLEVQFVDKSVGDAVSWLWDFGDNKTATEQNPKHPYIEKGRYTVRLAVSGKAGTSDVKTREGFIEVLDRIEPTATPTPEVTPVPTPTPEVTPTPSPTPTPTPDDTSCLASKLLASDQSASAGKTTAAMSANKADKSLLYGSGFGRLEILRMFRDTVLSRDMAGIKLIRFYYQHSKEVTELLNSDTALKVRAVDGLTELTDMLGRGTTNKGDSIRDVIRDSIPLRLETGINRLIDEIAGRGSDELKHDIEEARRLLDTGY